MIRDCLEAFYTPQEKESLTDLKVKYLQGRIKAEQAILAYINDHPSTNGKTVTIPADYVNAAFSDYNEAVSAWQEAREPVIKRYAESVAVSDIIQNAKDTLRGIRWKDIEHHPFSRRFVASISRKEDTANVLVLILAPFIRALSATSEGRAAFDAAMSDLVNAVYRKADRIEDTLKKKEGADNAKED